MRIWGRVNQENGLGGQWVAVETDANGYNDAVRLTQLVQVLKLNLGESPFNANYGIPSQTSVLTQVQPDYYMNVTQQQFAGYFGSLILTKVPNSSNPATPEYRISMTTQQGSTLTGPIPT